MSIMVVEPTQKALMIREANIWAFDSEFLASGRSDAPEDVHTVQFSDGDDVVVLESAQQLKDWLADRRHIKVLYGFVVLPDLGSVEEWLGRKCLKIHKRGSQTVGRITYGSTKINVFDTHIMAKSLGFRNLAQVGEYLGIPKLSKPEWLGLRKWQTESERQAFLRYAEIDAIITSKFAEWLISINADPSKYASAGTIVKDVFRLPMRLKGRPIQLSPIEALIRRSTFAGRSEGFVTGYTPNVLYNDVSSLYPCSMVATQCLRIKEIQRCDPHDLTISQDLNDMRYGWIEGVFSTENDLWGIPIRARNNVYVVGNQIYGLFNTLDLSASKAKIEHVLRAWKPIFRAPDAHTRKYAALLIERIEKHQTSEMNLLTKAILNAASGKLGQAHPIATTSNFFAYNVLLGHSHLIMSLLFDRCPSEIIAMDTDSIFTRSDMMGKYFDVTDGEYTIPIRMDVKGKGDLAFFRSKRYILKGDKPAIGAHGWRYFYEDYLKMFNGDITELTTRQDIKHTLMTREIEALKMAKGRWRTKIVKLDLAKLKELLTADPKRNRESYDSYQLVMEKRNIPSRAWRYEDLLSMTQNPIGFPA